VVSFENDIDLGKHGWLVDTPEDYAWISPMFDALYREGASFGMNDILAWLHSQDRNA